MHSTSNRNNWSNYITNTDLIEGIVLENKVKCSFWVLTKFPKENDFHGIWGWLWHISWKFKETTIWGLLENCCLSNQSITLFSLSSWDPACTRDLDFPHRSWWVLATAMEKKFILTIADDSAQPSHTSSSSRSFAAASPHTYFSSPFLLLSFTICKSYTKIHVIAKWNFSLQKIL